MIVCGVPSMQSDRIAELFMAFDRRSILFILTLIVGFTGHVRGQNVDKVRIETANSVGNGYSISLEPVVIDGFSGLQSFAAGQYDGKWVLIGGRTDGLHRRQPFASFAPSGNNTNLFVIDHQAGQSWSAPIKDLPPALNEHSVKVPAQFRVGVDKPRPRKFTAWTFQNRGTTELFTMAVELYV